MRPGGGRQARRSDATVCVADLFQYPRHREIEPLPVASRINTQEMPAATAAGGGAAAALLDRLAVLGVSVRSGGGALRLAPVSLIPADVLAEVRANKAALIALLTAPIVAAAVAPRSSLGPIPADRGYHARQPDRDAPAIAPSPDVADGYTAALAAAVAALRAEPATGDARPMPHWPPGHWRPRRYTSDLADQLWTSMARPISWADPAARPEEGSFCSNCEYATWTRDKRRADGGWCCSICHPADNVPVEHRDEVRW